MLSILTSCAQVETKSKVSIQSSEFSFLVDAEKAQALKSIIDKEMIYIEGIAEEDFKAEIKSLVAAILVVDYKKNNCSIGQIACSTQSHINTLFINDYFFMVPSSEQFTSFLHEAWHLKSTNFEHTKCLKQPEWGYECDDDINSPYGIEYKYLLHKYMHTKDDNIAQLLLKIRSRLNNF